MEWMAGLDRNAQAFIVNIVTQAASELVTGILKAAGSRVAKVFAPEEKRRALGDAMNAALSKAIAVFPVDAYTRLHYEDIFHTFLSDETVLEELALLVDPHSGRYLNVDLLREQFMAAGYDPDLLPDVDFVQFIGVFSEVFYEEAAQRDQLQGVIEINLLRDMAHGIRHMEDDAQAIRTSIEQTTIHTQELPEIRALMEQLVSEAGKSAERILELSRVSISRRVESPGNEELNALEKRLRQHYIRWFAPLSFQGIMPTPTPLEIPLKDAFVSLSGITYIPEADTLTSDERELVAKMTEDSDEYARQETQLRFEAALQQRITTESPNRIIATRILAEVEGRAVVVLGDPGSGKTTLLRYISLALAEGDKSARACLGISSTEARQLPIFFPLAAFHERSSLMDQISHYYDVNRGLPGMKPVFERALKKGKALLLFDGLDEIVEPSRRREVSLRIKAFLDEHLPEGNRAILTSRFLGYREAPIQGDFPHISLVDLGYSEIEQYVQRWCLACETWADKGNCRPGPETVHRAQAEEKRLMNQIHSNPSVEHLAANPLLLSLFVLIARQADSLPSRRVKLYQAYLEVLVEQWQKKRQPAVSLPSAQHFDLDCAMEILTSLGFWLRSEKSGGTATRAEMLAQMTSIFLDRMTGNSSSVSVAERIAAKKDAEGFLRDMRHLSGVIVEGGKNAYGFLHLTFEEYFAGRALARMCRSTRNEFLAACLHDERWREPILLCVGQLGVIQNRDDEAAELVHFILNANSTYEKYLHRDLLLAGECAADNVNINQSLLEEIVDELFSLFSSQFIQPIANRAAICLARLRQIPSVSAKVMTGIVDLSKSEDRDIRCAVALAFGAAASNTDIRKVLLQLLGDKHSRVRFHAVQALASVTSDSDVCRALLRLLGDKDSKVRDAAAMALRSVASQSDMLVELLRIAQDQRKHDDERSAAAYALGGAIDNDDVRAALIDLVGGGWGPASLGAVQALAQAARYPDVRSVLMGIVWNAWILKAELRYTAGSGLRSVAHLNEVRTDLLRMVKDYDEDKNNGKRAAAAALALEPEVVDDDVRTALLNLLASGGKERSAAGFHITRSAAWALRPAAADMEVRTALLSLLTSKDRIVRAEAVEALGLAANFDEVRIRLLGLIRDSDLNVAFAATRALRSAASHPDVRQILLELLRCDNAVLCLGAAIALQAIATDSEVRDALLMLLDSHPLIRTAAYESVISGLRSESCATSGHVVSTTHNLYSGKKH